MHAAGILEINNPTKFGGCNNIIRGTLIAIWVWGGIALTHRPIMAHFLPKIIVIQLVRVRVVWAGLRASEQRVGAKRYLTTMT